MPLSLDQDDIEDQEDIQAVVACASAAFSAGALVIFPTETVYGVGASALSDVGLRRLREVKGRSGHIQPFTIHLPDPESASRYADMSHPFLRRLVDKVWPGPVTLVVDVSDAVMGSSLAGLGLTMAEADRLYHEKTVGLRCPAHGLGRKILGTVDGPVVASSANVRGASAPRDYGSAVAGLGDQVGVGVDGGMCGIAKPSTILRITMDESDPGRIPAMRVIREGVYDQCYIEKLMARKILLVCSGNTCRSPMAAGLARLMWPDDVEIKSAGTFARLGERASEHAVSAAAEMGVAIGGHRSSALDVAMIHEADVIYGMTQGHVDAVLGMTALALDKTHLLDAGGGDVSDPFGGDLATYKTCGQQIRELLRVRLIEDEESWL